MNAPARTSLALADILQVEDDPAVLGIACPETGIPLWTMLRIPMLRSIMSDALYATPMVGAPAAVPKAKAAATMGRALLHNAVHARRARADVLLMATGVGNLQRDGRWFNRLSDHFVSALPAQTLVVEDFFNWRWPFPRHNPRVLFSAPTQAAAALHAAATCDAADRQRAAQLIDLVAERARRTLGWQLSPARAASLQHWLARKAAATPWLYQRHRAMLQALAPRVLIKEEACYGPSAVLIRAARDLGIATAEYQHGAISGGHDAYNVAPALRDSAACRSTLPEHLLAYGPWWVEQIDIPVRGVAIGNPHRSAQLARAASTSGAARDVLVLGDGIETLLYMSLAERLAARLAGRFQVVFRPHPLEREAVLAKYGAPGASAVRIDPHVDLYDALRGAHAVVSELSTGLFEAVGLVDHIFIWDTPKSRFTFPRHPFAAFQDADHLAMQLEKNTASAWNADEVARIWQPDWRTQYLRFLASVGCDVAPEAAA